MQKKTKSLILLTFLIIIYMYTLVITSIPGKMVVFEGEEINIKTLLGLNLMEKNDSMTVSSNVNNSKIDEVGVKKLTLNLFDKLPLKSINVSVLPRTKVIPVGNIAGVKLYTSGVLVVGMSEIEGKDNKIYKPYENTGIKEGDTITKINNKYISSTDDLIDNVNKSNGDTIEVTYIQNEQTKECSITPVKTDEDEYKIGLWVRDSAAGVGTVTFYEPDTKTFGALGHGIADIDTGELLNIASGEFVTTRVLNITKGEKGNPGKIQGTIENQQTIGEISKNTGFGIYGKVDNISSLDIDASKEMEVALRDEIKLGKAKILCNLDNKNVQEYEIEIKKIYKENNYNNKSMEIEITDERLINKTGGIIQGMSRITNNSKWKICRCSNTCIS
ncbi:MAG: SpoIVB peptidase [Clostridia bacterium]|nr:SpoIVB peptidase [Clostridium sp.]